MSSVFRRGKGSRRNDCAAIFVHAGAGYHSIQNESVHLQACNDAALAAMRILHAGGTAVDAVEMACRVLEDREITNAGYGSNLAIDGVVEGDAVIVDHYGRSGGCGAVSRIKNPISLARCVLDLSTQELSLRRVPPNLLVGQGAIDFAASNGISISDHDDLISPAARDRWNRWKHDLKAAERKASKQSRSNPIFHVDRETTEHSAQIEETLRHEHETAIQQSVWNEGQPISPPSSHAPEQATPAAVGNNSSRASSVDSRFTPATSLTPRSDMQDGHECHDPLTAENLARNIALERGARSHPTGYRRRDTEPQDAAADESQVTRTSEASNDRRRISDADDDEELILDGEKDVNDGLFVRGAHHRRSCNGLCDEDESRSENGSQSTATITPPGTYMRNKSRQPRTPVDSSKARYDPNQPEFKIPPLPSQYGAGLHHRPKSHPGTKSYEHGIIDDDDDEDDIVDTIGAIAIDNDGNIACGASSGGIGMKFRGRMGPAALVGVGAAVCPHDQEDRSKTCTASVASGTGEHMATTMAANVCAERLFHGIRKRKTGTGFEPCEDDQAVRSMIEQDFMEHPSVKHSHSAGAIGVLAVKKTANGTYLYFAHNTDSFALASMHADEPKPTCTMSRSQGNGMLAQGGRAIRYNKRKW